MNQSSLSNTKEKIESSLIKHQVAILPPLDVMQTLRLMALMDLNPKATILDPWYNKGVGGVREDYHEFILGILQAAGLISEHVMLWGFPEIVASFVEKIPKPLQLVAWLTWYYKNSPSVIRGWRSSQMTCLHLARPKARMHPENFLNEVQNGKLAQGKLRFMPGPTSVIEAPLNVGFVGKKERTGHPAQKPMAVFEKLILMTTAEKELVLDPMSGAGTTAETAIKLGRIAIIADHSEEYTQMAEERLQVQRITIPKSVLGFLEQPNEVPSLFALKS